MFIRYMTEEYQYYDINNSLENIWQMIYRQCQLRHQ